MNTLDPQDLLFSAEAGQQIADPYTDDFPVGGKSRKGLGTAGWLWIFLTIATFALGAAYIVMGYAPGLYVFAHHGF